MRMTILKKKTGYALGLLLCIVGIILILILVWGFWEAWPTASTDMFSALGTTLLEGSLVLLGIEVKLMYYAIFGIPLLIVGGAILIARREKVTVTEETTVLLECPQCKNQWRESMSKTHLDSMGYPNVKTLSRRKCSKCAKFIRPKIVTADL